jgi:hypothetical protein
MDELEVAQNAIQTIHRLAPEKYVKLIVGHSIETLLLLANGIGERCICHKLSKYAKLFSQDGLQPEILGVHPGGI